jgi:dolichol-phosphate mannosyltransferase
VTAPPQGEVALSVVIPVFECADHLPELDRRLEATLDPMGVAYEIVYVDDGSTDGAWGTIEGLAAHRPEVRGARLSRNFGQQAAITAGLSLARGDQVVVMDGDLQEEPESIPRLVTEAAQGFDVVLTVRDARSQSFLRRTTGRAYFRLRNALTGAPTGIDNGTMSLMSRKVVDAFLEVRDVHREYLAVLGWLGFRQASIVVPHRPRAHGRSSYTWRRLLRVGWSGILFQTTVLLRWVVAAGLGAAAAGFALAIYDVWVYLHAGSLPGYTSLAVLILFVGGSILIATGIVGLYVGATFEQTKGRPLFVVADTVDAAGPRAT